MMYVSYARPFREEYLNKLMIMNEFFLAVQTGFVVAFTQPFGTRSAETTYSKHYSDFNLFSNIHNVLYLSLTDMQRGGECNCPIQGIQSVEEDLRIVREEYYP